MKISSIFCKNWHYSTIYVIGITVYEIFINIFVDNFLEYV